MTTIEIMARISHLDVYGFGKDREKFVAVIERFATLVRADEREAFAKIQFESILQAIRIEREACAKVCENIDDYDENIDAYYSDTYAAAIRARGEIK